jgi:predicted lipoprotein with Yx(FWY)xxD motif
VKRALFFVVPVIATAAVVAGCGSSSSSSSGTSGSSSAKTTANVSSQSSAYGGAYGSSSGSASPSGSGSSSATATMVTTKDSKFGTIIAAGPKQLTVYLFEGDKGSTSSCSGACAAAWPPVTTSGTPTTGGQAVSAHVGMITRSGGTKQVTYDGHPLYYFVKDKDSGDAYGQGVSAFGASWYVLAPSGQKVDNS